MEHLLDGRRHAVHLIDQQDVAIAEVCEHCSEVAGRFEHLTGGRVHGHAQLVSDDVSQGRLAEARRPVQQHMAERFPALARCRDRHLQIRTDLVLADVFVDQARPQAGFVLHVLVDTLRAPSGITTSVAPTSSSSWSWWLSPHMSLGRGLS